MPRKKVNKKLTKKQKELKEKYPFTQNGYYKLLKDFQSLIAKVKKIERKIHGTSGVVYG